MKRMLFLLMTILLGMNVSFASDKESKKDAENMALYEEAVKAVKEKKFVVKYHTTDVKEYHYEPAVRKRLNSLTNFLVVDGNTTLSQYDNGRRIYGFNSVGTPNYHAPKAKEGKVSDVSVQIDAKGKVTCILSYNNNSEITEITFKKGSNECTIIVKSKGIKRYSWGTIHSIGGTEIRRAS